MNVNNNLILTDCDGVLLDWEKAFEEWMQFKGYYKIPDHDVTAYGLHIHYGIPRNEVQALIKEFNESAAIGYLQPMRESEIWVPLLAKYGFRFVVITSLSTNPYSAKARENNLKTIFGDIFDEVVCLDVGADKENELVKWVGKSDFWVEDKWENAVLGGELGFKTFLMNHDHNNHHSENNIIKVENWNDIAANILESIS